MFNVHSRGVFTKDKSGYFSNSKVERHGSVVERCGSVVVSTSAWHAAGRWFDSRTRHGHVSLLG